MISVIIPTLNESQSLPGLLESLAGAGFELWVVDGGSDDGTSEIARASGARVLNGATGRAAQMNLGARNANGEVLVFLHADSVVDADFCTALSRLEIHRNRWGFFRPHLLPPRPLYRMIGWCMWQRSRITGIATGDMAIWCSRSFVGIGDPVFPNQPLMEDIEFSKRARARQKPVAIDVAIGVSARRWERRGVARTVLGMWLTRLRYFFGTPAESLHRSYYG